MRKIKKMLLITVASSLLLLTACQPTPEKEIIVDKSDVFFETSDATKTTEQATNIDNIEFIKITAPSRVESDAIVYKNISIAQSADVIVPEATAYPVTEVNKRIFTNNDIIEMIKLFTGDTALYTNYTPSKEDVLTDITFAKQNLGIDGITQEYIDGLQELYNLAPEKSEKTKFDITKISPDENIIVYTDTSKNTTALYSFKKDDNTFGYSRNKNQTSMPKSVAEVGMTEESKWSYPKTPNISESDAFKIAQEWIDKLGVDLKLRSSETCAIREYAMQRQAGWKFVFTREIAGMQPDYNYYSVAQNKSALPSTGAPWEREFVSIVIDEEGVCSLAWKGASNLSKTVSKSERLKDFEVIKERVINQINFIFGTDNPQDIQIDYTITKYELGIAMISVKDRFDLGLYIPAWYVTYEYDGTDGVKYSQQIIFNAIDGSYIEPRITNKDLMEYMN